MSKAMVVGSGGREHALGWKLQQELGEDRVLFVPGNGGVPDSLRRDADVLNFPRLHDIAMEENVSLVVVGPEAPLSAGLVDYFHSRHYKISIFGPTAEAAIVEASKAYTKKIMAEHDIPTAEFEIAHSTQEARDYALRYFRQDGKAVIKADGLAEGKGTVVCKSEQEINKGLEFLRWLGRAAETLVVERFLEGEEVSYVALVDGSTVVPLLPAQDHKAVYDGDEGPNTGGMGAYTRPRVVTPEIEAQMHGITRDMVSAMARDRKIYKGALYGGFKIVDGKAMVLEWNCRLGDPETQPVMALLDSPLYNCLMDAAYGSLAGRTIKWKPGEALTVVLATQGYPGSYKENTGKEIYGLDRSYSGVHVFHAGTSRRNGSIVNSGGRVLGVTGIGIDLEGARRNAYAAIGPDAINFEGMQYRKDIGWRSLR